MLVNYNMPDLQQHNYRILVLGTPGSGKSTLARKLSLSLKTKAIHLDKYYWKPGWVETTSDLWDLELNELQNEESWVMDGNYINSLTKRILIIGDSFTEGIGFKYEDTFVGLLDKQKIVSVLLVVISIVYLLINFSSVPWTG